MRAAVYAGTRNIYADMIPSMKSLLMYSNVDKIYFLIEDDEFPYELPPEVECINVSNQKWFDTEGPNFISKWSYMILLRAALTKLFPDLDRILSLDCDTIVRNNISELWDLPLDDYYFAGVYEPEKSTETFRYINAGVMMFNLKKIREDHKDDEYIYDLNNCYRPFPEQECFSALSQGKILELSGEYNLSTSTATSTNEKILHFAANKNWRLLKLVNEFRIMPLDFARNQTNQIALDIIIPTYVKVNNLKNTLESIEWNNKYPIRVTVIDDASGKDYSALQAQYPQVQWLQLEQHSGPGVARQYGNEHTNYRYIAYLDSGDIFKPGDINKIFEGIEQNPIGYFYIWRFYDGDTKALSRLDEEKTCGKVYRREFIERYNIRWSSGKASYACEDYGFVRTCNVFLSYLQTIDGAKRVYTFNDPITCIVPDVNSITRENQFEFVFNQAVEGLVLNNYHIYKQCRDGKIPIRYIIRELNYMIVRLYWFFLITVHERPEFREINWIRIKDFYDKLYSKYELEASKTLAEPYYKCNTQLIIPKMRIWKSPVRINIGRFLSELRTYKEMPGRYKLD